MRTRIAVFPLAVALITIGIFIFSWQGFNISMPNASAVTAANGIGVYWNQAATNSCQSIPWGKLFPGSSKTMVVYLKNENTESLFYLLTTEQWYPANASNYMVLKSDYDGNIASPGSVRKISLTLSVSSGINRIVNFSFNMVIKGNPYPWGDVNYDGRVDIRDIATVAKAYGSYPGAPDWNEVADINGDGRVDIKDIAIASKNYGKKI